MAEYRAGPCRRRPTHPGRIVLSSIRELALAPRAAASRLGVPPTRLANILAETSPVTPEMALRLAKFFGNGAEIWLALQQGCDLWDARQGMAAELAQIKPVPKTKKRA
jgi:addiction module HigA family antidote